MATTHRARVIRVDHFVQGGVLLRLQMEEPTRFPHIAGQYIIVNSELSYPNGKAGKRAYSLFGVEQESAIFHLAAERIKGGLVSQYLCERQVGDQVLFSGPWGKFHAPAEDESRPLVAVAFATGITALLGIVGQRSWPDHSQLIWVRDENAAFIPESCVFDLLSSSIKRLDIVDGFDADADHRAWLRLEDQLVREPLIYCAGEGGAVDRLEARLKEHGFPMEAFFKESFFRLPPPDAIDVK